MTISPAAISPEELAEMNDMTSREITERVYVWSRDGRLNDLLQKYTDDLTTELLSAVEIAGLYCYLREKGNGHNFAEMVATNSAPGGVTDRELFAGRGTLLDQFGGDEKRVQSLVESAKKNYGFTPNVNDVYDPQLAPATAKGTKGHPDCFVPATGGLSHYRAIARKKGMNVLPGLSSEGQLRIEPGDARERKVRKPGLGENIVRRKLREAIQRDPSLKLKDQRELREKIIDKHALKK